MARFYSNENFPVPVVDLFRELGHDVVSIQERGYANESTSDEDVLAFATAEDRAVVTLNRRDFIRLHAADASHAGIVVCTVNPLFGQLANAIHEAVADKSDLRSLLIRVNRPSI